MAIQDAAPTVYTGGVSYRFRNASWPLARLTIGHTGITIGPSSRWSAPLLRVIGLSDLHFGWEEIDDAQLLRSRFPPWRATNGVRFTVRGKTLTWWSTSKESARAVVGEAQGELQALG